jgi:hypothetical protein
MCKILHLVAFFILKNKCPFFLREKGATGKFKTVNLEKNQFRFLAGILANG